MRIAIEGCAHGELDRIYGAIAEVEKNDGKKVDLLICCGDFQSTRNLSDLECMAVPKKYRTMCSFYKYYSGEKVAPVLTLFIGGNHEASNYLQELPYGGWVAPNIYYLGYAGVVSIAGVRIAALSGIYKGNDYLQGHHEFPPYSRDTIRSVYHVRNLEVFRLKQLSGNIDIFLSHDWPRGITQYGDEMELLKRKFFLTSDVKANVLGSPPNMELLKLHYPSYWFSAHLHCKFAALVPEEGGTRATKFLALDKCLPKRKFLQILEIPHDEKSALKLHYDLEWLTILYATNHLLAVRYGTHYMPGPNDSDSSACIPTKDKMDAVLKKFNNDLQIPINFKQSVEAYCPMERNCHPKLPCLHINEQTTWFCNTLGVDDPLALLQIMHNLNRSDGNESITRSVFDDTLESRDTSSASDEDIETTFDSTMDESISFTSVPTLSQLNLPSPNYDNATSGMDDSMSDLKETNPVTVTELSKDFVELAEPNTPPQETISFKSTTEPDCKKFKRRNHNIYSTTI
ncbi:lariat debranching enzyme [Orussus abietinus]|uniref:lariat debranching enzyme n=1 Tax=Orussus abietinus TaxID=222816 RepID=UPI000624FDB5|nr:lariat debranching enzyme [Orussus abietinus]